MSKALLLSFRADSQRCAQIWETRTPTLGTELCLLMLSLAVFCLYGGTEQKKNFLLAMTMTWCRKCSSANVNHRCAKTRQEGSSVQIVMEDR